jgi:hypothetical protein
MLGSIRITNKTGTVTGSKLVLDLDDYMEKVGNYEILSFEPWRHRLPAWAKKPLPVFPWRKDNA